MPGTKRPATLLAIASLIALFASKAVADDLPDSKNAPQKTYRNIAVTHLPPEGQHFSFWQKINPVWWIGNADTPNAPDWYRPARKGRNFYWHLRNPFHNFTFYVLGIADKPFVRVGPHPRDTANPNEGWNHAICRYKCLRLPFVDYKRGGFEFYAGWRTGGNLGFKLNFKKQKKPVEKGS